MTHCQDCKHVLSCKTKTSNRKIYCLYCGCIEDACHCKDPMLQMSYVSRVTLTKSGDCKSCRYLLRCTKAKGLDKIKADSKDKSFKEDKFCRFCGCLKEVCHCHTPKHEWN